MIASSITTSLVPGGFDLPSYFHRELFSRKPTQTPSSSCRISKSELAMFQIWYDYTMAGRARRGPCRPPVQLPGHVLMLEEESMRTPAAILTRIGGMKERI